VYLQVVHDRRDTVDSARQADGQFPLFEGGNGSLERHLAFGNFEIDVEALQVAFFLLVLQTFCHFPGDLLIVSQRPRKRGRGQSENRRSNN